jgi:choline dehydrogenase-like flavoprotein
MGSYHIVAVGSGFSTSFFLKEYLRHGSASDARVLVLERGPRIPHADRVDRRMTSSYADQTVLRRVGDMRKQWAFSLAFGGSSNCWWGCTPRFHPSDFRLHSLYGVGRDWPISYDDIEGDYCRVEEIMQVSGSSGDAPYPRSRPYPQPPHNFTDPERLLKSKYPDSFFHQATARARLATGNRPPCCANGICGLCPVDAKFTIENGLAEIYRDPRVELRIGAEALAIEFAGGVAQAVRYREDGREAVAKGDIVLLAANAIYNPYLMLKSGMTDPAIGRGLSEQASVIVDVDLKGVQGYQGSTSITGNGYMYYDGPHRATRGACMVETRNIPTFRLDPRRWRERMTVKLIAEDLPQDANRVELGPAGDDRPTATFQGFSPYAMATIARAPELVADLTAGLPVERIHAPHPLAPTEGHVQCTTPMGRDPAISVVDSKLTSHRVRNLVVLGASTFPTVSAANPTLTVSALSTYAARQLSASGPT